MVYVQCEIKNIHLTLLKTNSYKKVNELLEHKLFTNYPPNWSEDVSSKANRDAGLGVQLHLLDSPAIGSSK